MPAPADGFALPRRARLRRRREYLAVQERGRRFAGAHFLLFFLRSNPEGACRDSTRFGVTVSKKVGNAVVRNRVKRWIREVGRQWLPAAPEALDVVVVARPGAGSLGLETTREELAGLLRRLPSPR